MHRRIARDGNGDRIDDALRLDPFAKIAIVPSKRALDRLRIDDRLVERILHEALRPAPRLDDLGPHLRRPYLPLRRYANGRLVDQIALGKGEYAEDRIQEIELAADGK